MNRIRLQFALGLLFVATCSRGQQNVPPAVRGEMPPATSESGLKNVLTGGFSVTSSYDDNALSTVDNHSSDTQFAAYRYSTVAQTLQLERRLRAGLRF